MSAWPRASKRCACRSGIVRGRKRCGKSISEGCVCRLGRTEDNGSDTRVRTVLSGRARAGCQGGCRKSGVCRTGTERDSEPGGAKRKSALGSAVHHFGCAEVILYPSRRRRDAHDILFRSDLSLFLSLFLIIPLRFSVATEFSGE